MNLLLSSLLLFAGAVGGQWETVPVATTASLRGLSVVSQDVVWASGTEGTVIRTVDSGKHWSVITVPGAEKLDFRGIHAFDGNNAVIISSGPADKGQARIYRTTDGGTTWKQVVEEKRVGIFFDAISFWDRKHGIVLSDPVDGRFALFTTDDGGVTWKQIPTAGIPPALPNEGAFAASNSCLTVQGGKNVWFATGGASVARVFRSANGGRTWSVAETPMHPANASSGIFSLAFQDSKYGVAVGGDYAHPATSTLPNFLYTGDGGRTWEIGAPSDPPGVYFSSVVPVWQPGKDNILAVGVDGTSENIVGSLWVKVNSANLNSVAVTHGDPQTIWAVGPKGVVMRLDVHDPTFITK